ncbi:MAG: hypothetical protein AB7T37_07300 [Dehalococcoidia bacterium]
MAFPAQVQVTVAPTPTDALRGAKKLSLTVTDAVSGPEGVIGVGVGGGCVGVAVGGGWVAGGLVGVGGTGVGVWDAVGVASEVGVGEAAAVVDEVADATGVAGEAEGLAVDAAAVGLVLAEGAEADGETGGGGSELLSPPPQARTREATARAASRSTGNRITPPPPPDKGTGWPSSIRGRPPSNE